jgi:DNA-binding transcriptional LysR family regulator
MLQGRLDAAFVRTPVESNEGLIVDHVLREPMLAVLPVGHDLVRNGGSPLPLVALAAEPFILYRRPSGPGLYDAILAVCRGAGFSPTIAQEAPRLPSTLSLVAAGLGITIVPASMAQIAMPGVAFRTLQGCPGLSAPINLALRRGGLSATAARFRETVRKLAT